MTEYHTVYKDVEGTTTEWDDLQVKYGNLPAKEKPKKEPWVPASETTRKDKDWLNEKSEQELEELDDELDDDRFMEEYRRKRLQELRVAATKPRFGSVELIKGQDFVHEVSQAPPDVWVVLHLFKDGVQACGIMAECLNELARKYPGTKFLKIISTDCIADYPDFNLPTLLVYNNTSVKATLVGLQRFGGKRCSPEDVAFALLKVGPVLSSPEQGEDGRASVAKQVQRDYVEKLLGQHEDDGNGDDSD
eukprot:jgi/Mesen1/6839/ME000351S05961